MYLSNNIPDVLKPVIEQWNKRGKSYFLSPKNLFIYKGHNIKYIGGESIPENFWFAKNGEASEEYQLSKKDIEEIQNELLKSYRTKRWTITLDWHCNYTCPMCPYHGEGVINEKDYFVSHDERKKVVTKEEAYKWIDKLEEYGIETLSIMSMGEIVLYPYWREVSKYAQSKGMKLWTITNGSLWNEELVKEVAEMGYTDIRVSLDALSFDVYSKIRSSRRDYYENAMNLPELLLKYGINTNVHFVRQKENIQEVEAFIKYWKEKNVTSISIANQFCYDGELVVNKCVEEEKDYIGGLCTAFGNMVTEPQGDTAWCCGMNACSSIDLKTLEQSSCEDIVNGAIEKMRDKNSDFRKMCSQCSLYVPYSDEEIVGDWKVSRNTERETWIRI